MEGILTESSTSISLQLVVNEATSLTKDSSPMGCEAGSFVTLDVSKNPSAFIIKDRLTLEAEAKTFFRNVQSNWPNYVAAHNRRLTCSATPLRKFEISHK